ncbi:MAG: lysophospholipid acyltransferase family protein [Acidobacteriaceae bacterium]|nr:lysophospholipid acyltransferase family protein [Acidobacteriaceae bacterium]
MPTSGLLVESPQPISPGRTPDRSPFHNLIRRLTPMARIRDLYRRAQQPINRSILENVLAEMKVECVVSDADLARIPLSGPAIVTANHPFGLLDGAVLGALLTRVRPDVKILTNIMLAEVPELHDHCFFVDPFGARDSIVRNRRGVKQAISWLRSGGMLAMFPAGEVSHLRIREVGIADPEWNSLAVRLVRLTDAVTLPVFLPGCNSATFQALGLLHPRLRTAWLINEFLGQTNKKVEVRIGSRIPAEVIFNAGSDADATRYLRWRTYILSRRGRPSSRFRPMLPPFALRSSQQPIVAPASSEAIQADLNKLSAAQRLYETSDFTVYGAKAREIPALLHEIGRLREITFRGVGEGSGRAIDLDSFDFYYTHVILWSRIRQELVGAYRLGLTTEILPTLGVSGLYTNTLFRYDNRLLQRLGPALELGRSFVRPEYQRQYAPLLTLWKGIGRYIVLNPEFATLFGAVSISNRYSPWSRELIYRFFESREGDDDLRTLVNPRHPFRPRWTRPGDGLASDPCCRELEHLLDPISDVERDGKSLPILLRHYAKLGGRLLSFNVDRNFSNVLDGFVLVDLRQTSPELLSRYLGSDGAHAFGAYHSLCKSGQ